MAEEFNTEAIAPETPVAVDATVTVAEVQQAEGGSEVPPTPFTQQDIDGILSSFTKPVEEKSTDDVLSELLAQKSGGKIKSYADIETLTSTPNTPPSKFQQVESLVASEKISPEGAIVLLSNPPASIASMNHTDALVTSYMAEFGISRQQAIDGILSRYNLDDAADISTLSTNLAFLKEAKEAKANLMSLSTTVHSAPSPASTAQATKAEATASDALRTAQAERAQMEAWNNHVKNAAVEIAKSGIEYDAGEGHKVSIILDNSNAEHQQWYAAAIKDVYANPTAYPQYIKEGMTNADLRKAIEAAIVKQNPSAILKAAYAQGVAQGTKKVLGSREAPLELGGNTNNNSTPPAAGTLTPEQKKAAIKSMMQ